MRGSANDALSGPGASAHLTDPDKISPSCAFPTQPRQRTSGVLHVTATCPMHSWLVLKMPLAVGQREGLRPERVKENKCVLGFLEKSLPSTDTPCPGGCLPQAGRSACTSFPVKCGDKDTGARVTPSELCSPQPLPRRILPGASAAISGCDRPAQGLAKHPCASPRGKASGKGVQPRPPLPPTPARISRPETDLVSFVPGRALPLRAQHQGRRAGRADPVPAFLCWTKTVVISIPLVTSVWRKLNKGNMWPGRWSSGKSLQ